MNPDIKARWVAALRSGEYKQGKGLLHQGDQFCCLGVLCDLAVKAGEKIEVSLTDSDMNGGSYFLYDGDGGVLPPSIRKWAGIRHSVPFVIWNEQEDSGLAGINDGGATFAEIADLIEEQL